ncbi:MAG: DUF1801 domain-containing protein [Candidatus Promineofilum sp.]|nr:DUF1801 domain-containing protein [Promineifilum sp.]
MAELKTKATDASVEAFLNSVADEKKRADAFRVLQIMREETGEEPQMWGESMVGFGRYHYQYASGRQGDWPLTAFSPRKANLTLYITPGFDRYEALLAGLGKFTTGKSCLYVKRLSDVDETALRELVRQSVAVMRGNS